MIQKKQAGRPRTKPSGERIIELLRNVPREVLLRVVPKFGLIPEQTKELCEEFKRIK